MKIGFKFSPEDYIDAHSLTILSLCLSLPAS